MRIAIITLPLHGNYGGILQNYALQTVLKRMGHTVETIVLPWKRKLPLYKIPLIYSKRFIAKYVLRKHTRIFFEKWFNHTQPFLLKNMWRFIAEYIATRKVCNFNDIVEGDYNAFVVGSDQIWRPAYSYKPISLAYLYFAQKWKEIKRVAYAASFGTEDWEYSNSLSKRCSDLAKLFDGISVREDSAVELCMKHLHCKSQHVLDPAMLLSANDYKMLFENKLLPKSNGELLVYILNDTIEKSSIVQNIATHYSYKAFYANSRYEDYTAPLEERVQPPIEQWLKDFYDAKFVITDSFHATAFSIIFGKPFIVIGNKRRGLARIKSLLHMFDLESHIVNSLNELDLSQNYTYDIDRTNTLLESYRKSSLKFLKEKLR